MDYYSERFTSEMVIHPGYDPKRIEIETEAQYSAVGRKAAELLRTTPAVIMALRVETERAEHMERDPGKQPSKIQRMTLDTLRLDSKDQATVDNLWRIINQLQRRISKLENPTLVT